MKNRWLAQALLCLPLLAMAQTDVPTPAQLSLPAMPSATQPAAATAFDLVVVAPDDVAPLLGRHLELQRYRTVTDLSDQELDRLLDMARADAVNLVATLGYFAPVITVAQLPRTPPTGTRRIQVTVQPGEPTQVKQVSVHFEGDIATNPQAAAQRQRVIETWLLPAGNRFTQTRWDAAKQQALRQLTTERYPTGRIQESLADIDPQTHAAQLQITLDSGQPYQLGALEISGLKRFDAQLVQRLARVPTGADYDLRELVAAQQRLAQSGYFDSAFVSLDPTSAPQAAKVMISVREAPLQKITLGVGASTDSGGRLSAEHLHHQVPGLGWRAVSKVSLDRETQSIGTELTSPPNTDGWRWSTGLQLQNQRSGTFDIGSQRWRAGTSQATQRIDRNYYLQYDRADTATSNETAASVAESVSGNFAFTLRNFDSLPFPSSGWAWGVELGAGTTLGNPQVPYSRILTRWQSFWPLGARPSPTAAPDLRASRLALRAQAGAVLAKDGVSLPATQLFLAGGDNSVRGYALHDIGITLADGRISAGRYVAVGSLEWQRPITNKGLLTDWEGTLFVDVGSVADTPGALKAKVGVGTGVRWKTPVGPLQMDLAYGVDVKRLRLHLNVGFVF